MAQSIDRLEDPPLVSAFTLALSAADMAPNGKCRNVWLPSVQGAVAGAISFLTIGLYLSIVATKIHELTDADDYFGDI